MIARPKRRWHQARFRRGLLVLIGGVSLYLLFPSLVAVFGSWRSLSHLDWYWAGLALLAEIASFVSLWELDRIALAERSWFVVACMQLSGNAVGQVVPGGGATATAFEVRMLRRAKVPTVRSVAALAASTALQIATTLALPLFALPSILAGVRVKPNLTAAAYLGTGALMLLLLGGVLAFVSDRPLVLLGRAVEWALQHAFRFETTDLPAKLLEQRDFIRLAVGGRFVASVISATGSTAFDYAALLCALEAVGASPRASLVLLAYVAAAALGLIPFTPGGLGFVEAGLVGSLTLAGIRPSHALVATLVYRLIAFWLPIPAGGLAYALFQWRYRDRDATADPDVAAVGGSR